MVVHSAEVINSLINKEGMSESLNFENKKRIQNIQKNKIFNFFSQHFLSESLIRSFIKSNLSESLTVAHLL